ncbi:MAG: hypothetical protein R3362_06970 [Rhodothermales bacterium]|nr:hypothetical protein [Rhodothermales bacterium]
MDRVVIPRKDTVNDAAAPTAVWPLVEAALDKIGADAATREAARAALETSDGCVVLANYLNSEAKRVHRMDYRFKVPLIVLAAELAREDAGADSIYCPNEGCIYFETDEGQYSFHVFKDWTVNWEAVADETEEGYPWSGVENQAWALDQLLDYLPTDEAPPGSEREEESA